MIDASTTATPTTEHVLPVRWRDLDPLGHVNNAVFLTYLEEGRNHWLTKIPGVGVDGYVVARIELDFTREVPSDAGSIVAGCRAEAVGRTSITTREELRTREGVLLADARVVIVLWDPVKRCTRPITDEERIRIDLPVAPS